jgi:hypothetical protein
MIPKGMALKLLLLSSNAIEKFQVKFMNNLKLILNKTKLNFQKNKKVH